MGWTSLPLPVVWAQAAGSTPTPASANPIALAPLALRRWCAGLTLCSPESSPSLFGLWAWLAGLGALLLLALAFQGPARALAQLFDVAGHARLAADAAGRLKRSGRMLAAAVGLTVLSWTGSQSLAYDRAEGRDDLLTLTKARSPGELAAEQGVLAGMTPLRDVAGLGSNAPLLFVATLLIFRASADLWGTFPPPGVRRKRVSFAAILGLFCGALLLIYRLVSVGSGATELPPAGCLMVEAVVVPAVMAVCDGLLLGWLLVELRGGDPGDALDTDGAVRLLPAAVLACLTALPARYLATAVLLATYYLPSSVYASTAGAWMRWQLSWGLTEVQAGALAFSGLAGAAAWGGGAAAAVRGYARMLAGQGGRLFALTAAAGLAASGLSAAAYLAVTSLPSATWVLNAADGYAHYATLPVGLWALAALVELGERSLPEAALVPVADPAPAPAR